MKAIFLTLLFIFPLFLSAKALSGRVIKIADGDTFTLLVNNKEQVKVRLYGIDAPEKNQAYGKRAKQYLSKLIWGVPVTVNVIEQDRYGRSIGKVSTNQIKDVSLEMIRAGYAWLYREYCNDRAYEIAEKNARRNRKGLWQDAHPIKPQEFRKLKHKK